MTKTVEQKLRLFIGTIGVDGPITAHLEDNLQPGCTSAVRIRRLSSLTVGTPPINVASVGVFLITVPPETSHSCSVDVGGEIYAGATDYGTFSKMFVLSSSPT
ncbi:MAG: hypothetical protein ACREP9_12470 [Candidatus Dormibacteraceae bacterium]